MQLAEGTEMTDSTQKRWMEGYYAPLVGMTIERVEIRTEEVMFGEWLIIHAVDKTGERFQLEVSRDEEGNGPGFVFGLPMYTMPKYAAIDDALVQLRTQQKLL